MVDRGSTLRTVLVGAGLAAALIAGVLLADTLADNPGGDQTDGAAPVDVAEVGDSLALGQGGLTDQADPSVPEPLPEATLAGFDGGPQVALSSYRGSPLIVNFWATWCAPCVAEMPALQTVSEQLRGDVALLGVNYQDAPSNAATFVHDLGITYDLATDADGSYLEQKIRGYGMPTTLLVDPDGTIVYRHTGPLTVEELRSLLTERLGVRPLDQPTVTPSGEPAADGRSERTGGRQNGPLR